MPRRRLIRPRPVPDWESLFWRRAENSFEGNDLECRRCRGCGLAPARRVCRTCRGSGLLVPYRRNARASSLVPDEPAWTDTSRGELIWPAPWAWVVPKVEGYYRDDEVMGFTVNGMFWLGLFVVGDGAEAAMGRAFEAVAGEEVKVPGFEVPTGLG